MRSSRIVRLAERRRALVKLLIALVVARIVTTVGEIVEERLTFFSVLITAALALEAWRAYAVTHRAGAHEVDRPSGVPELPERILSVAERVGPALLYAFTAVFAVIFAVFELADLSQDTLLDISVIARDVTTVVFVAILLLGYLSLRDAPPKGGRSRPNA